MLATNIVTKVHMPVVDAATGPCQPCNSCAQVASESVVPKLTSKGQVTIPKWLRDSLGLKRGSSVQFEVDSDGRIILRPKKLGDTAP
jgi:AbrB family looped-hinge helix DNA binding protein